MRLVPLAHAVKLRRPLQGLTVQIQHKRDQLAPLIPGFGRRIEPRQRLNRVASGHVVEHLARGDWAHTLKELHDTEARHPVNGVLGPP